MDISFEQREAIRCLYAYGCEGAIGPGGLIYSSGGSGSAAGIPILGTTETWLRLVSLDLATGHGPHRIRLTAQGEEEARRVPAKPQRDVPIEADIAAVRDALREAEANTDLDDGEGQAHAQDLRDTLDGLLAEQRREA